MARRYPGHLAVLKAFALLDRSIPVDEGHAITVAWRVSEAGVPNLRVTGWTGGERWYVDIYHGHFYRIVANSELGEIRHSLIGTIQYLRRRLGIEAHDHDQ